MNFAARPWSAWLAVIGVLAGCGPNYKKLSEDAISKADRFVAAAKTNGAKILPDVAQRLDDSLKAAKEQAAAKNYKDAYNTAVDVANGSIEMARSLGIKRAEFENTYKQISAAIVPAALKTINTIKQIQRSRKVPEGLTKESFDSLAKESAGWEDSWKQAVAYRDSGEVGRAYTQAVKVRDNVLGAMKLLKLQ